MNRDRDKEVKRHQATQRIVFIVSALLLLLTSRAVQARDVSALKEPAASPGSVAGVEKVASYSSLKLRLMLWLAHLPEPRRGP